MAKALKLLFGLFGLVIGLVVVAMIALPLVFDPNDHKDRLVALVEEKTGRSLEIEGDIDLSVFPWLGADIGTTRLGNAPGFEAMHMATMQGVELRVRLLPLLRKEVEVDTLRLAGLELYLEKDSKGRTNYQDLLESTDAAAESKDDDADEPGDGLAELEVRGIDISGARLSWDDRQSKQRYELSDIALTTGEIETGEAFALDLSLRMQASEPAVDGRLTLDGDVLIEDALRGLSVQGADIRLDATGDGLPGGKLDLALSSDVALDLAQGTLTLPAIELSAWNLDIRGDINGTGLNEDTPAFKGAFTVQPFNPRALLKSLGQADIETADKRALETADATLTWNASNTHFAVSQLTMHLDETTANGTIRVDSFDKPSITFGLDVDRLNVDRYLPPPPEEGAASDQPAASSGDELPMEALRALNLKGKARVKDMTAINLKYTDAEVSVKAANGVVRLYPFGAQMYGGSYRGDVTLDARGKQPRLSVNEKVSGVQAGPLLNDLMSFDKLEGKADVTAKFSATGITPESISRTVNGNAVFSFADGAVKGVNIAALIRKAQAQLKGQPAPPDDLPNQTDFALLKGSVTASNGLVRNDDLTLQSPFLRISGKGQTHLAEETIDYLLTAKLVGSLEGQGGKSLEELKGVAIPVRVGGTYSKPTYTPDLGAALSEAAKAKVEEKIEKKTEKIKEKIGDKLGEELLKGLFK